MPRQPDLPHLIGSGQVLQYYANLKGIPLAKVLRNAARDIAYGAYQQTPEAPKINPNPWALLPGKGKYAGKGVHLNLSTMSAEEQARLSPFRIAKPRRGYALSAFIPLFQALEFKKKGGKKPAPQSTLTRVGGYFATRRDPYEGAWKREVESYRKSKTGKHNSLSDYSASRTGGGQQSPWHEVRVTEFDLSHHPGWSDRALAAGSDSAARNILDDLMRTIQDPNKNTIK